MNSRFEKFPPSLSSVTNENTGPQIPRASAAFTRLELLCLLGAIMLMAALISPVVASNLSGSERAMCINNLRRIAVAFQVWGNDHGDRRPIRVPMAAEGTQGSPFAGNAWYNYSWLSNQLGSPKILRCPSDRFGRVATNWGNSAAGGFVNASYRGNAISYFVGTDTLVENGSAFLAGDRDVRPSATGVSCSAGINTAASLAPQTDVYWLGELHGDIGNVLFNDGRVESLSSAGLVDAASKAEGDFGNCHILLSR